MAILVTGGAGYIGSHTCVELLNSGYDIIVVDNLSNSSVESLNRVKEITGKQFKFYEENLLNRDAIDVIFKENTIEAVIHFAGLKAVGESVAIPLTYYHNNITSTLILCDVMQKHNVKKMIFSSSATVYGLPETSPITEEFPLSATNPYGQTKLMIEQMMRDVVVADSEWSVVLLRYFNPFGAHESGRIGEDPNGIPNNLMPYVTQVAVGKLKELSVFGNDYPTKDGTGVRDYIHVVDLANGHVKALEKVLHTTGVDTYNLGTGTGYSVLEMVQAFEKVSGKSVPYKITERRPGDVAVCFADASKAKRELGWEAKRGLEEMCADSWKWQSNNKNGYQKTECMK
ncbi:UDP-glucose 4-epimerase GalE [Bacillus pseudomycoides]|uniref:UDP-glucose 4-epimerase GalE n=1 Tax=Bacillus pseudomycoides TaxID=64104 RepID=UPI000BEBAE74|nr:UDP-glucose 4-epimerase GalE [Bacillus pseudomycoides]PEA84143.1 UDP-glucose 4-epimerase GalE [Bacillus pseudomycoides]PEI96083.1 UDP-glucose 4-epimerase GalE [Bacillus pseudomycoides]PEM79348.1 UDP-glucose 4-epimerase GalE [Bacillus pseudomycoides]PFZ10036.1 UDP-glucose 4-epimerase GalE [Bacillus pseudomycoides]PFZ11289.1 UDP-glucose 4-epimerase GalE [Bacillus pseudomycoides]